jgi:hypothetical protein
MAALAPVVSIVRVEVAPGTAIGVTEALEKLHVGAGDPVPLTLQVRFTPEL